MGKFMSLSVIGGVIVVAVIYALRSSDKFIKNEPEGGKKTDLLIIISTFAVILAVSLLVPGIYGLVNIFFK